MSKITRVLVSDRIRKQCALWCKNAKKGTRVTFEEEKRTLDQNKKLWPLLTDISLQAKWHNMKLSPESWRFVFLDGLGVENRIVPNWNNDGFISLRSTSKLPKSQFSDLIELIYAFGARNGVEFSEPKEKAA